MSRLYRQLLSSSPRDGLPVMRRCSLAPKIAGHKECGTLHAVRKLEPNCWGLYDTLANMWEWTGTGFSDKPGGRIIRGNSWPFDRKWFKLDFTNGEIGDGAPVSRDEYKGFRVVRIPESKRAR